MRFVPLTAYGHCAIIVRMRPAILSSLLLLIMANGVGANAVTPPQAARRSDGSVSLAALDADGRQDFEPDFGNLAGITAKTACGGYVTNICCFILTDGEAEAYINDNQGTTKYQGHYVWSATNGVIGFGTYTADKTTRSFGWILYNDTGKTVRCEGIDVTYGQWGARNTQPDALTAAWRLTTGTVDWSTDDGWTGNDADAFVSPAFSGDKADFPILAPRSFASFPRRLPPRAKLALRFTDRCPKSGSNAHLGIARLRVRLTTFFPGLAVFVR